MYSPVRCRHSYRNLLLVFSAYLVLRFASYQVRRNCISTCTHTINSSQHDHHTQRWTGVSLHVYGYFRSGNTVWFLIKHRLSAERLNEVERGIHISSVWVVFCWSILAKYCEMVYPARPTHIILHEYYLYWLPLNNMLSAWSDASHNALHFYFVLA